MFVENGLNFNDRRLWRVVFALAFVFRAVLVTSFSYLHPDEHIQGPQVVANGLFGWAAQIPWEFTVAKPLRSFVPLWILYGIPMSFFSDSLETRDPVHVLYGLRVIIALLTWILEDMAVDRLSKTHNDKLRSLLFVSTSYVTWTWQAHTLSNSLETVLVLWFLVIIHEFESGDVVDRSWDSFLLGLIGALGFWNRPTFVAFIALPSAICLPTFFLKNKLSCVTFVAGLALTAGTCIYVDTMLYSSSEEWVVAPLNHLRFNASSANLEEHGLHSRWTHLVVNLPQLLGPGLLLVRPRWTELPMQAVVSAMTILSYVPHQEARFLVPLVPLLATQMDLVQFPRARWRNWLLGLWLTFNVMGGVLMGFMHQSGVIPAEVHLRQAASLPSTVLWYKTYTPPLWITGLNDTEVAYAELSDRGSDLPTILDLLRNPAPDRMTVVDLLGASESTLAQAITAARKGASDVFVVVPVANSPAPALLEGSDQTWISPWHISLEHLDWLHPRNWRLGLSIHHLRTVPNNIKRGWRL